MDIENELSEAEAYLRALDVESRSSIPGKTAAAKMVELKNELKQLSEDFAQCRSAAETTAQSKSSAARTKLTSANQRLDQSTRTLESSRMLVAQTQEVGGGIIQDLEAQREQLEDASGKVQDTQIYTANAKDILKDMHTRAIIHKVLVYLTIVILFGVICIEIYFGFLKKNN